VADIDGDSMSKEAVLSWAMGLGAGGSSVVQVNDAGGTR
jgi:hypothetical protein